MIFFGKAVPTLPDHALAGAAMLTFDDFGDGRPDWIAAFVGVATEETGGR